MKNAVGTLQKLNTGATQGTTLDPADTVYFPAEVETFLC